MDWVCINLEKKVGESKMVVKVCFRPKAEVESEKIVESWKSLFPDTPCPKYVSAWVLSSKEFERMHRKAEEFGESADMREYGRKMDIAECAGSSTFLLDELGKACGWGIFIRDDPGMGIVLPHELTHLEQVLSGRKDWKVKT